MVLSIPIVEKFELFVPFVPTLVTMTDRRSPAGEYLGADVCDLGEVSAGGRLADHLGAPALALHRVGRHPELVLGAGPQLGHAETGAAPSHLV